MPYRSEVEALEARRVVLEREVADRTRERDDVAWMLAETRARQHAEWTTADLRAGGPKRRFRRRLMIIAAVALTITAAGLSYLIISHGSSCHGEVDANLDRFEAFADEICLCTTELCAREVMDRLQTWGNEAAKHQCVNVNIHPDDERAKRGQDIGQRFTTCYTKTLFLEQQGGMPLPEGRDSPGSRVY